MEWLELYGNLLLSNLEEMDLSSNELTGEIPAELGKLSNLEEMDLSSNELTGEIPAELGKLNDLKWMRISDGNEFTGCVPWGLSDVFIKDFDRLPLPFCTAQKDSRGIEADRAALVAIYHATDEASWTNKRNWLSDRPLEELDGIRTDDLGRVIVLDLSSKHLRGHLPRELGLLSKLERLDLRNNALTGEIPAELGNLTNLKYIDLRFNGLTGEIPAELGQLSNLGSLNLYGNKLTGEISADR